MKTHWFPSVRPYFWGDYVRWGRLTIAMKNKTSTDTFTSSLENLWVFRPKKIQTSPLNATSLEALKLGGSFHLLGKSWVFSSRKNPNSPFQFGGFFVHVTFSFGVFFVHVCQGRSTPMTFPYNRGWKKSTQFRRGLYTHEIRIPSLKVG